VPRPIYSASLPSIHMSSPSAAIRPFPPILKIPISLRSVKYSEASSRQPSKSRFAAASTGTGGGDAARIGSSSRCELLTLRRTPPSSKIDLPFWLQF
jgi:hypothetical protein